MDEGNEETRRKPRTTKFSRAARDKRIVERAREGVSYHEIAEEEGLSEQRVRQIVTEVLEGREALERVHHARLQIDRICRAVRAAGAALERGDVRAVGPFLKAVEKLDRYHVIAREMIIRPANAADDVAQLTQAHLDEFGADKEYGMEPVEAC